MGNGESTEGSGEKKDVTLTDTSTKISESSSGFHLLEIHMPSMGLGLGIVVFAVAIYLAWWHRRKKRQARAQLAFALYDEGRGRAHLDTGSRMWLYHNGSYVRGPRLPPNTRLASDRFEELPMGDLEAGCRTVSAFQARRAPPCPHHTEIADVEDECRPKGPAMARS